MIFPLGDDNPTRTTPWMTWLIVGVNALVFGMYNLSLPPEDLERWTLEWGYDVAHPLSRQLFSSMFMHGGWEHIFGNMWVLWIVGNNVEDKLGKLRYLALYLAGGCAAALVYSQIAQFSEVPPQVIERIGDRHPPLVGASGAIAAVMGMYLVFFPEARVRLLFFVFFFFRVIPVRAKWFLGMTLALDLFRSVAAQGASVGGVATMAHVGGGVFGIVAALVLKPLVGGGGEGDAWDVHTGFSKRPHAGDDAASLGRVRRVERAAPEESDEDALAEAEGAISELVRAGRVREAIDVYPAYVELSREQPLPDDVQIEIAHEFYRQWLPKEAIPAYLRYLATHPTGPEAAEAKFRLGVLYARGLNRRDEGARWLREAVREHRDPAVRAAASDLLAGLGG